MFGKIMMSCGVMVCGLLMVCARPGPAPAAAYQLPDTGQHKCYNDAGTEITCPRPGERFYGQDAQYQGPEPAFRDNGNGTVTDLNTGLMWQQGDDQNECAEYSYGCYTWEEAGAYCDALTLAGYTDWRLPDRRELVSIVNYAIASPGPTIDTRYFPNCRSSYYWSGSTYAYSPYTAWNVSFGLGSVGWVTKAGHYHVRCVRAGS